MIDSRCVSPGSHPGKLFSEAAEALLRHCIEKHNSRQSRRALAKKISPCLDFLTQAWSGDVLASEAVKRAFDPETRILDIRNCISFISVFCSQLRETSEVGSFTEMYKILSYIEHAIANGHDDDLEALKRRVEHILNDTQTAFLNKTH